MASLASNLLRGSGRLVLTGQLSGRQFAAVQKFHSSPAQDYSHLARNSDGKFTCTLIPGDGVGPELVTFNSYLWTPILPKL